MKYYRLRRFVPNRSRLVARSVNLAFVHIVTIAVLSPGFVNAQSSPPLDRCSDIVQEVRAHQSATEHLLVVWDEQAKEAEKYLFAHESDDLIDSVDAYLYSTYMLELGDLIFQITDMSRRLASEGVGMCATSPASIEQLEMTIRKSPIIADYIEEQSNIWNFLQTIHSLGLGVRSSR